MQRYANISNHASNQELIGSGLLCENNRSAQIHPLNVRGKDLNEIFGSPKLVKRLKYSKWLVPLYESNDPIYPWSRILAVQTRLENGEMPPQLPSDAKRFRSYRDQT